jgi:uncharacterized surface protein with fasciclin (FAS1) repeats
MINIKKMETNKFYRLNMGNIKTVLLVFLILGAIGCNDPVTNWSLESKYMVMTEYVQAHDEFSEFGKMLDYTRAYSLLNTRGPFTLFVPTNEAIDTWYTEMGVNSFTEFEDTSIVYNFVNNHIVGSAISTSEFGLGALRETNILGDYIVSDFYGDQDILSINTDTVFNADSSDYSVVYDTVYIRREIR